MAMGMPSLRKDRRSQIEGNQAETTLKVKSGTRVMDRSWHFLKEPVLVNQHTKAGSSLHFLTPSKAHVPPVWLL